VQNVKSPLPFATIVACAVLLGQFAFPALAQTTRPPARPAAQNSGVTVALIDIGFIFKHHTRLHQMMEDLKNDAIESEKELQETQKQIANMVEQLREYTPGSTEYSKLERQIALANNQWKIEVQLKRKANAEERAKVYFKVYQEVDKQVALFAQRYGVDIVLRFNRSPVEGTNPQAMMQAINFRNVLYHDRGLDITERILDSLAPRWREDVAIKPGPRPAGEYIPRKH